MASVGGISSKNQGYSLNPLQLFQIPSLIWRLVAPIFQRKEAQNQVSLDERDLVVYRKVEEGDWNEIDLYETVARLLDQSTRPYSYQNMNLDQIDLVFAKAFFSDIERSGEPDQFVLNEEIIPPPRREGEKRALLRKLLEAASGDPAKIKEWTEIWNYRIKSVLLSTVMDLFFKEFALRPVFGREDYRKVSIALDTVKNTLCCRVLGKIEKAIDDRPQLEMPEIRTGLNISYDASFEYNLRENTLLNQIRFS